jgi:hypothetical protein
MMRSQLVEASLACGGVDTGKFVNS